MFLLIKPDLWLFWKKSSGYNYLGCIWDSVLRQPFVVLALLSVACFLLSPAWGEVSNLGGWGWCGCPGPTSRWVWGLLFADLHPEPLWVPVPGLQCPHGTASWWSKVLQVVPCLLMHLSLRRKLISYLAEEFVGFLTKKILWLVFLWVSLYSFYQAEHFKFLFIILYSLLTTDLLNKSLSSLQEGRELCNTNLAV